MRIGRAHRRTNEIDFTGIDLWLDGLRRGAKKKVQVLDGAVHGVLLRGGRLAQG